MALEGLGKPPALPRSDRAPCVGGGTLGFGRLATERALWERAARGLFGSVDVSKQVDGVHLDVGEMIDD